MDNEKKSGICTKCGKQTDDLKMTVNTAVSDDPIEVCPECFEEIDISNRLYAKAVLVGGVITIALAILIGLVVLIFSVC